MLKLALFGNPVAHSLSPQLHQRFASQAGIDLDYQKLEAALDAFPEAVEAFATAGGQGFNITVPFKQQAFVLAHCHSERAQAAQAVNTMMVLADGSYYGDNTDGIGFVRDCRRRHLALRNQIIVIHGAGGAVRGLIPALLQEQPRAIWLLNRSYATALSLSQTFTGVRAVPYGYELKEVDVLIDGSSGACQDFSGLAGVAFSERAWGYDLKYATSPTAFLRWATARGLSQGVDGFGMLVEQAAASFTVWTGFQPNTDGLLNLTDLVG